MGTHQCAHCKRHLLVGESFRRYRRRLRGAAIVCSLCREHARSRGWVPLAEPVLRQQTRRARYKRSMPLAHPRTPDSVA